MSAPWKPREAIEVLIRQGDLDGLLRKAGELHGHFCPHVALGVRAGYLALQVLKVEQSLGLEEVVAIVETNSCFSDGVQVVTGCTFANNGLIFKDLGKTAVTVARRDGSAVRVALRADYADSFAQRFPEATALFDRIVTQRQQPTPQEQERLLRLWAQTAFMQLDLPDEEVFLVQPTTSQPPPYVPLFASIRCQVCGENVMENRIRIKVGKPVCITCAGVAYGQLDGTGFYAAGNGTAPR